MAARTAMDEGTVPVLELTGIRMDRSGVNVLNIPSLRIDEGEVLSLIGPNGAGKTTLLETLCGLRRPVAGSMVFRGMEVGTAYPLPAYRKRITMVFQQPLLFDSTVFGNVASGLGFRGMKGPMADAAALEALKLFGIEHLSRRSARRLSGGEAQRVSLARAFAVKPEVILLDEPFASLDPPTRETLISDFESVLRLSATTVVFVTHDRMEALRLSHRIAVMDKGEILQIGTPEEVMNRPANPFVASFVGMETILGGQVVSMSDGTFAAAVSDRTIEAVGDVFVGEQVLLCVRPEDVTLSANGPGQATSARNTFPGRIEKMVLLGPYHKVRLDCGFPLTAYVTKASARELGLREGSEVTASFKATAIHVVRK